MAPYYVPSRPTVPTEPGAGDPVGLEPTLRERIATVAAAALAVLVVAAIAVLMGMA